MVEGEVVHLATANRKRQWPRNVAVRPEVKLRIGTKMFTGRVEVVADRATIEHVTDSMRSRRKHQSCRVPTWPGSGIGNGRRCCPK